MNVRGRMEGRQRSWPRKTRNQDVYNQRHQRDCSRIVIQPNDPGYSRSFGSRFQQQEDNAQYPSTFFGMYESNAPYPNHSVTYMISETASPSESFLGTYSGEDMHLDQSLSRSELPQRRGHLFPNGLSYSSRQTAEDVVCVQPFSRSNFPERRSRYSNSPSYDRMAEDVVMVQSLSQSNFPDKNSRYYDRPSYDLTKEDAVLDPPYPRSNIHQRSFSDKSPSYRSSRRDSTKYKDYYDEVRHPRNFKGKYHANHWEDTKDYKRRQVRSPGMPSRFTTSERSFKKPMTDSVRFGGEPRKQVRHVISSRSEVPPYRSKGRAPGPVSNSAKVSETKCLIDSEVASVNKLATKSSKDVNLPKRPATKTSKGDAKANYSKKPATKSSKDNVETGLTKKPEAKSSKNSAEAKLSKKLATNLSEDNTKTNHTKKLATKLSEDYAEANVTKNFATKSFAHNAEANLPKKLGTNFSQDNAEANLSKKLETKTFIDIGEANLTEKLETKPVKSDDKEVECETQNDGVPHGSSSDHNDSDMENLKARVSSKKVLVSADASSSNIRLMKDEKLICHGKCTNPPIKLSSSLWNVDIVKKDTVNGLHDFPWFLLFPSFEEEIHEKNESQQRKEWILFLTHLHCYSKVAIVELENMRIYVFPPECTPRRSKQGLLFPHAVVAYELRKCNISLDQKCATSVGLEDAIQAVSPLPFATSVLKDKVKINPGLPSIPPDPSMNQVVAFESDRKGSSSAEKGTCSSISKCHEAVNSHLPFSAKEDVSSERNFVRTDPSYLKSLGQAHSGWIFGAVAELVDNSRDARATRLEIAIETIFDKTAGCDIPMLSIIDDGVGMNHQEILRMISFGHKAPDVDNQEYVGRFGVGFKTGSMRLGKDALVLTQTTNIRSIAFLSQTLNEGKDNVEIPVVSYSRQAQYMEIDTSVQSEELAKYNLNAMKEYSPFNEYLIGEKAGLFGGKTGTQIYIWNLDKWGSDYTLEWQEGLRGGSSFHKGDIYIRSRRVRTRPGQTSRKVYMDYSLHSYLEVIFLDPRMKIYVQGSLVKSRPLAKSLNNTALISEEVMGKQVHLTLGRSQLEWDEANCGIFLYWHGRLIEAYKRVGGMIHSADMGRGVIGVIDVSELMDDGNGGVWVHSNKQGFQDCEPYALLEEWLGKKADEYWDTFFDPVQLKKGKARYKPDNEWVQCDKCRKWRLLNADFDSINLPKDWFCFMEPFNGRCEMPEQKPGRGVITVGLKRSSGHDPSIVTDSEGVKIDSDNPIAEGNGQDESTRSADDDDDDWIPIAKRRNRNTRSARKYMQE